MHCRYFSSFSFFLLLYGLAVLSLSGMGADSFEHLHLLLDSSNGVLSLLLAVFLLGEQHAIPPNVRKYLAISFAFAAAAELLHALVGIEWSGSLAWVQTYSHILRPATWPPSTYILPIAMAWAMWLMLRKSTLAAGVFAASVGVLTVVLFALFFILPKYVDTGLLGIQRPTQVPLLFLWLAVIAVYWRERHVSPLFEGLAWMGVLLFLSDLCMLYSTSPHEKFTMMAHTGKLLAYMLMHVIQMRVGAGDSRARSVAEAALQRERERLQLALADLQQQKLALGTSEAYLRTVLATIPDLIWMKDMAGVYLFCNAKFERLFGASEKEIVGKTDYDFVSRELADFFGEHDRKAALAGKPSINEEAVVYADDGHSALLETIKMPMRDAAGNLVGVLGIARDITERKAAEDEITRLAFYDYLTRLPNRRLMMERLQQAMAASLRNGREGALLFIDLDHFKEINDTYGHDAGDLLLQQVSERLVAMIREGDTAARIGGDEFVVMLEYLGETREEAIVQARAAGEKILAALGSYELAGRDCHCTPSIGIALFNARENTVDELLRQADTAMYQAKSAGRNALCFYDPAVNGTAVISS